MTDLTALSIAEARDALRRKAASAVELTEAYLGAIERANGSSGVVVLMDMGSAVLSTELALELMADPAAPFCMECTEELADAKRDDMRRNAGC